METRKQRIYKNTGAADISKCKGTLSNSLQRCTICYVPDASEKIGSWDLNYNHHALYYRIINFMKERGWEVAANTQVDKIIRKGRFVGKNKYGIEFESEIYPNGFRFEFYQDVTKSENPHGGRYDHNKYLKMPYLLKLSIRAEMNAILNYCKKLPISVEEDIVITNAIDKIIDHNQKSTWHKKHIKTFEDLKNDVCDEDYNNKDKNGILIKNGDIKYFYNNRRLLRGTVYHNINNMWWVVLNDTKYTNISSFSLFDYSSDIPFREELSKGQKIQKLHSELKKAESNQNYERCITLREMLKSYKLYRVWSIKHGSWWGPNNCGYTNDINKAGVYTHEAITSKSSYYNDGVDSIVKEI